MRNRTDWTLRSSALPLLAALLTLVAARSAGPQPRAVVGKAGAATVHTQQDAPRLVVILVVDQLRADLLDRYDALFKGGFRRLRDGGFRFTNGTQDHGDTETGPGHAAISTGLFPAHNGITSNEWHELGADGQWHLMYCVGDSKSPIVGQPEAPGRSPANLFHGGFADWLLAARPGARVVSVSRKDRAAITLAGQSRTHVYWILSSTGRFVTSRYYGDALPGWVARFNADSMPRYYADSVWTLQAPPAAVPLARPDSARYEWDGVHTAFPHHFGEAGEPRTAEAFNTWVTEHTPFADAATLALARTALVADSLGRDAIPDYLAVSVSQTDAAGHDFGPFSLEQLDNLLRLDRELGVFFADLDRIVGRDRWLLALSADHGVMTEPEYVLEHGGQAHRISREESARMRQITQGATAAGGGAAAIRDRASAALAALPWVSAVYSYEQLGAETAPADSFIRLYRNSYVPGRASGSFYRLGLAVRWTEGTIADPHGSTHGTAYLYDRTVPILFYGAGIRQGVSAVPAHTVDIAPTLAAQLGIAPPAGIDGRSLQGELRRR